MARRTRQWCGVLAFVLSAAICAAAGRASSAGPPVDIATLVEAARTDSDLARYPAFRAHVVTILHRKASETRPLSVNPYVAEILGVDEGPSVALHAEDVLEFFDACARDRLTILRAMAYVARTVRSTGVLAYLNGADARGTIERLHLSIGLAVPMEHLLMFAYVPLEGDPSPDEQCRFVAIYDRQYEHRFTKQVLNATLKIGTGKSAPYLSPWDPDAPIRRAYVVEGTIIYGEAGFGFVDVSGIGGRKHGMLGTLQRLFFFLPDAIGGMVVRDGDLYVNAIMDQRVANFEARTRYAVHERDGLRMRPTPRSEE